MSFVDSSAKDQKPTPQIYLASESPCFDERIFEGKLALAEIKTLKSSDKVYFMDEPKACPASGECAWKRKAFLVSGDVVYVSEKLRNPDFECAHYVTAAGDLIYGFLPRQSLKEVTKETSIDQGFEGKWRRRFKSSSKSASLIFELKKNSNAWHFKGKGSWENFLVSGDVREAALDGDGKQETNGDLIFQKKWQRANVKGENKTLECVVKVSRQGPNLLVHDNDACGGSNATLSGMYHRF